MGYSDPKYHTRALIPAVFNATATATMTASGHVVTNTAAAYLQDFNRRSQITAIRVKTRTAPNSNAGSTRLVFLNGTNTLGVVSAGTAGQTTDGTLTASNAVLAADTEPTVNILSTATASTGAVTQGNYDIWFEVQELFS